MATVRPQRFGDLLKRYRMAACLTQEGLAERAGLSVKAIGALERGARRVPRRDTMALLVVALGLSPAERSLFEAARQQTASPLSMRAAPRQALTSPPLVGRAQELALIEQHLSSEEGPLLLLVTGEPGIGKSRLLQAATLKGRERGWTVLEGGCHRRSGQDPYHPFVGMLVRHLAQRSLPQQRLDLQGCGWLVRLLPELADLIVTPTTAWTLPPEQERRLMFAAVARFLANVADVSGTLLMLDDVQWAGADALDLLAYLLQSEHECPLRMVSAYRDTEVRPQDPVAIALADLTHQGLTAQTVLRPLRTEDARELLTHLLVEETVGASADGIPWEQALERAEGVPFFLTSYAQELRAGTLKAPPVDSNPSKTEGTLPWTVAQSIRRRMMNLPEGTQDLLRVAAVVGRRVARVVLMRVARAHGQSASDMVEALDAACAAGLLVEDGKEDYVFGHDLIQEAIVADLSAARRAHLHQLVAEALEGGSGELPIEALAHHYSESGGWEKAIAYLERAGDKARACYAYAEAESYFRDLVAHLDRLGRPIEAARIREKLGYMLFRRIQYEQALSVLEQALQTYQRVADIDSQGRTTVLISDVWERLGKRSESIEQLELAVGVLQVYGPSLGLAALYTQLADLYEGRPRKRLEACQRAEECAPAAYHTPLGRKWRAERAGALLELMRLREARTELEELLPEVKAAGDAVGLRKALFMEAALYLHQGSFTRERQNIEEMLEIDHHLDDRFQQAVHVSCRGRNAFHRGDWQEAQRDLEDALLRFPQPEGAGMAAPLPYSLGLLRQAVGNKEEAQQLFILAIEQGGVEIAVLISRWAQTALAEAEVLEGRPEQARIRLDALLSQTPDQELGIIYALPILAWAQLEVGASEQAEATIQQTLTLTRAEHMRPVVVTALRVQALLGIKRQRWEEAQAALEESLELCRTMPYPYAEAKTLHVSGQLHQARGESELARQHFQAALAILNRLGERLYAEHVERAFAALSSA